MQSEARQNAIAHDVIGCSIAVHRTCGPGCFESTYRPCLEYELTRKGLRFEAGVWMDLVYADLIVPRAYQLDLIVEDAVLVELKAVEQVGRIHGRQVLTYLKLTGLALGLLVNFGAVHMGEGVRRIVNNFPDGTAAIGRRSAST